MRIDPDLLALRGNPASQRAAQAALEGVKAAWRSSADNCPIFEELTRYGAGGKLSLYPALGKVVGNHASAQQFVADLTENLLLGLGREPLGQIPFRHQYSGGMAVMQLVTAGRAVLSLVMYERCEDAPATHSICFTDSERHEIALAGRAQIRIVRRDPSVETPARLNFKEMAFDAGCSLSLSGVSETKMVTKIANRLIILRLSRTPAKPQPAVEYRISDGALLHRAAGERSDSRHELMMSLLGQMGRKDAAPAMVERTRSGSDHLRWQALRECLALDTAAGFAALCAIARDSADPLCASAGALRAQLIELYPQLAALEDELCPA